MGRAHTPGADGAYGDEGGGLPARRRREWAFRRRRGKDISGNACRAQPNAILQPAGTAGKKEEPEVPRGKGCTFCGHCLEGCIEPKGAPRNLRAKRSTDTSYVPMALTADKWGKGRSGRARRRRLRPARRPAPDRRAGAADRRWGHLAFTRNGQEATEAARVVVLAGGSVETPRLWFRSGLPNPNDLVGRGLTDHYPDFVIGRFGSYTGSTRGPGSNARADFPGYGSLEVTTLPPGLQAYGLAFSASGIAGFYDNGRGAKAGADVTGRLVGTRLKRFLQDVDKLINVLRPDRRRGRGTEPRHLVAIEPGGRERRDPACRDPVSHALYADGTEP